MDNVYFKSELKSSKQDLKIIEARFINALVLTGLSLIQQENHLKNSKNQAEDFVDDETIMTFEERVEEYSKAIAMVILPIIEQLGSLDSGDVLLDDSLSESD